MRPSIPLGILLCSVGFAVAAASVPAKPRPPEGSDSKTSESPVPDKKSAPGHKKPAKDPAPLAKPEGPEEEAPAEQPAESEDKSDCDECVLARGMQEVVIPAVAMAAAVPASTSASAPGTPAGTPAADIPGSQAPPQRGTAEKVPWPVALARTLWGLFFVGRPRMVPKTRIRGAILR